ncbi:MAG: HdeD family acid-resistance protein [Gammaproteobacteria bacterium]|nr:HdeD family acid-resistance protein [Gammaproteobacteria bacterium]
MIDTQPTLQHTGSERVAARRSAPLGLSELPVDWRWMAAMGVGMIVAGLVGVTYAVRLTLVSVMAFGVLAILAGGVQVSHAMTTRGRRWAGGMVHAFVGIAYLAVGALLVWDPIAGTLSLTIVMTAFLIALGAARLGYAWQCRRFRWRWRLALAGGVIDLLLAGLILYGWPTTSLWVIGTILAVELLLNGVTLLAIASASRRYGLPPALASGNPGS